MKTAEALLTQARNWLGLEKADGSYQVILDTYNTLSPLPRGHKMNKTDAWCACFVSACAVKTGMTDIIPPECSCNQMIALFKKAGEWEENEKVTPAPGWILFYDWQDDGKGDDQSAADHVGIVEKVAGQEITVIEGNYSGKVKRRVIKINGRYIRGYGVPRFEKAEKPESKAPAKEKEAVFTPYMAKVIPSNGLNVRKGPSTGDKKRGALSCGTKIKVLGENADGSWGMILWKDAPGWVCLHYVKRV